jgi:hypothetical protein
MVRIHIHSSKLKYRSPRPRPLARTSRLFLSRTKCTRKTLNRWTLRANPPQQLRNHHTRFPHLNKLFSNKFFSNNRLTLILESRRIQASRNNQSSRRQRSRTSLRSVWRPSSTHRAWMNLTMLERVATIWRSGVKWIDCNSIGRQPRC